MCATAEGAERPRRIRGAEPTLADVKELVGRVRERHSHCEVVRVCIESGAPVWVRLLHEAGAVVHVVDGKQARRFAESLKSSQAKSDGADACDLCDMLRSPPHATEPWQPDGQHVEPLLSHTSLHELLTKQGTRLRQQLRARLRAHMPLVDQVVKLGTQWSRRLLHAAPTPHHLRHVTQDGLGMILQRTRAETREAVHEACQKSEAPWRTPASATAEAMAVRMLLETLELVDSHISHVEDEMDALSADLPERKTLESMKGIGMRQAIALISFAFGGSLAHRDQAGIQLGAAPVFVGSGTLPNGKPKGRGIMRRSAGHRARRATYLMGRLAQQNLRWAPAMYADGRARGQSAATAYRRIARSLLRILTAMVRNDEPYDDGRYLAALKDNGVWWAMAL